jgi:GTP-binding protein Era
MNHIDTADSCEEVFNNIGEESCELKEQGSSNEPDIARKEEKCGIVSIVGAPNSGKSTLLNCIIGEKISIVSPKIQTTRNTIRGVLTSDECQIVFLDTPGFFKSQTLLEKLLISNLKSSLVGVDVVLLMIDPTSRSLSAIKDFLEHIKEYNLNIIAVINKVDIAEKEHILRTTEIISKKHSIEDVFMISARTGDGVNKLMKSLRNKIPMKKWMFKSEDKTDLDIKIRLSETTREKLFLLLEKELPYNLYVETESLSRSAKKAKIHQSIVVMKSSQKGIILGARGSFIQKIRQLSVAEMEEILQQKVELKLFVKVEKKWDSRLEHLKNAGII